MGLKDSRKRAAVVLVSLVFVVILLFVVSRWWEAAPVENKQLAKGAPGPTQENPQPSIAPAAAAPPKPPPSLEEGRSAAETVYRMITSYHTRMGENPVGTNAEITKALMGGNPLHATFTPDQNLPPLNAKGELIDPWGTPYFFHQLSGDDMEIHSAGPDKIMGTADDIVEH